MKQLNKNYYKVICKCGHVGRNDYVPIQYAIKAVDGKEAAKIARQIPRVKHNHKDAILKVEKIDFKQYLEIKELNKNDPYLQCHSRHEQNKICDLADRLVIDEHNKKPTYKKTDRKGRVARKLKIYQAIENRNWRLDAYEYCY